VFSVFLAVYFVVAVMCLILLSGDLSDYSRPAKIGV